MRLYALTLFITSTLTLLASACYGQQTNVWTTNGDFHPGAVLVYRDGALEIATPGSINRSAPSYVLVHGAHTDSTNASMLSLAKAIATKEPSVNVLIVDWSHWSKLNSEKFKEIVVGQLGKFKNEVLSGESFRKDGLLIHRTIGRQFSELWRRIVLNVFPVEQTEKIPEVSDRVFTILFGASGASCRTTTTGSTATFVALGLDPCTTHMIGHSHGAHVVGLVAAKCRSQLGKRPKRLTALEPSIADIHVAPLNEGGAGWNRECADFVDVWRTSEIFSGNRIYGDLNIWIRDRYHPLNMPPTDEIAESPSLSFVLNVLAYELDRHRKAIERFTELTRVGDTLDDYTKRDLNNFDSEKWVEISDGDE